MARPDPTKFAAITFDCYGTLIDWESGILAALLPLIRAHGLSVAPADVLTAYARAEAAAEEGPYIPYREVLRRVVIDIGKDLGFAPKPDEVETLVASMEDWEPFPDTVAALRVLGSRYRLGIISNVDDDLFAATRERLGVEFAWVVTAEAVGAYKPAALMFERALAISGLAPEQLLHAAQSLHHDIGPASELGIPTVHVVRDAGRQETAVLPSSARPDWCVPDLRGLVDRLEIGFDG